MITTEDTGGHGGAHGNTGENYEVNWRAEAEIQELANKMHLPGNKISDVTIGDVEALLR
jgi:hypothetical protein